MSYASGFIGKENITHYCLDVGNSGTNGVIDCFSTYTNPYCLINQGQSTAKCVVLDST